MQLGSRFGGVCGDGQGAEGSWRGIAGIGRGFLSLAPLGWAEYTVWLAIALDSDLALFFLLLGRFRC